MPVIIICMILLLLASPPNIPAQTVYPRYAVATEPVAVFNRPAAAAHPEHQKKDGCGQLRALEFIALPGTGFTIKGRDRRFTGALEVTTPDYKAPNGARLFVDEKKVQPVDDRPLPRKVNKPPPEQVLERLQSAIGLPYIWGGNLRSGLYGKSGKIFAGLDCSGLLYEATNGYTPRNSSELVHFGSPVRIEGKGIKQLLAELRPLDLIVWAGHLIIVLDAENSIEAILGCGDGPDRVVVTPLEKRLEQVMRQRRGVDDWPTDNSREKRFVVRRWL